MILCRCDRCATELRMTKNSTWDEATGTPAGWELIPQPSGEPFDICPRCVLEIKQATAIGAGAMGMLVGLKEILDSIRDLRDRPKPRPKASRGRPKKKPDLIGVPYRIQ